MPRRRETAPLLGLGVDPGAAEPLHRQLYEGVRQAILAGRLVPGAALPSSRALAADLGVARNTVLTALDQLASEGYVEGRIGAGTRVSHLLPEALLAAPRSDPAGTGASNGAAQLSRRGRALVESAVAHERGGAFAPGEPDCAAFPFELWARLLARHWRHPQRALYAGREPGGHPPLRAAVAEHLRLTRGVRCDPGQVIVVSGIRQAVDLAARVLLDPGDPVAMEEPGFPGIRAALRGAGARVRLAPVDAEGLRLTPAAADARLVCVAPSHQYPLGVVTSLKRRLDLIAWAASRGGWIVEDDWDSEFRYAGRPLAAMQGLDSGGRVIYVGSLSKVLFPSIRVGYLVAPPALVAPLLSARAALDDHASTIVQPALASFIAEGHLAAHVRRMRRLYAARQAALVAAAERHLKDLLAVRPEEAGMHLVADLAPPLARRMSDAQASAAAARAGIVAPPLSRYYAGRPRRQGLLLGYAAVPEAEIDRKVRRLAEALRA